MHIDIQLRPAASTNWIAVRWKSSSGRSADWQCLFCFPIVPKDPYSPIGQELRTAWSIFPGPLVSAKPQHFATEYASAFTTGSTNCGGCFGFYISSEYHDGFELLEINEANTAAFPPVELASLAGSAPNNALLAYVASAQRAVQQGGWLVERTDDAAHTAAQSIARIRILRALANLSDQDITKDLAPAAADPNYDAYNSIQWRERRQFLMNAIPTLAARSATTTVTALDDEISILSKEIPTLKIANNDLVSALDNLNNLTGAEAKQVISTANIALNTTGDPSTTDLDSLAILVVGAQGAVEEAFTDLNDTIEAACLLRQALEASSNGQSPVPDRGPDIRSACH